MQFCLYYYLVRNIFTTLGKQSCILLFTPMKNGVHILWNLFSYDFPDTNQIPFMKNHDNCFTDNLLNFIETELGMLKKL